MTAGERAVLLARLRREYEELRASLPAHSIPAAMLLRLEELEEAIAALEAEEEGDSPGGEAPAR